MTTKTSPDLVEVERRNANRAVGAMPHGDSRSALKSEIESLEADGWMLDLNGQHDAYRAIAVAAGALTVLREVWATASESRDGWQRGVPADLPRVLRVTDGTRDPWLTTVWRSDPRHDGRSDVLLTRPGEPYPVLWDDIRPGEEYRWQEVSHDAP